MAVHVPVTHISRRVGHDAEALVGDVQQTGGEAGRVGAGQAEHHENREDRQFDSDNEDLRSADELVPIRFTTTTATISPMPIALPDQSGVCQDGSARR